MKREHSIHTGGPRSGLELGGRMLRRIAPVFLLLFLPVSTAVGQWAHYADRNRVRAVCLEPSGEALWYATTGGLVRLDLSRRVWQAFGRGEGMPATDLTALLAARDGTLLIGSRDMGLLLRSGSGRWARLGEFDGLPDSRVQCVETVSAGQSETLFWVGTAAGARKFALRNGSVEPARDIPVVLEREGINDIATAADGTVWFATGGGLWRMGTDLAFTRFGAENGVGALFISQVESGPDGEIFAAWLDSLKVFDGSRFVDAGSPGGQRTVNCIRLLESGVLALATEERLFLRTSGIWQEVPSAGGRISVLGPVVGPAGLPVFGVEGQGLFVPDGDGEYSSIKLPGPLFNILTRVAVDRRGVVWSSGASDATPRQEVGVNRWDGKNWTHFTESNSGLLMNMISSMVALPDGRMLFGTWFGPTIIGSGGFNILDDRGTADPADDLWETYTANETPLSMGVIRGDMAVDSTGGIWVGSLFNQNQPGGLEHFDPSTRAFTSYSEQLAERRVLTLEADGLGNVWIGYQSRGLGVIPGGRQSGTAPRRVFSFIDALGETGVTDMAVDLVNRLWILTASKAVILNFQENATDESGFNYIEIKPPGFGGLAANAVEIQGLDAAWFATYDGIWRYGLQDGQWSVFNRGNSGLASDRVNDIALDRARRVLWAATDAGLSALSLDSPAAAGEPGCRITVRPNPWRPENQGLLMLDGIPRYSRVSILTVSGEPVRRFDMRETGSGMLLWDGTNQAGRRCASGVYIVLVSPPEGRELTAKVALIR